MQTDRATADVRREGNKAFIDLSGRIDATAHQLLDTMYREAVQDSPSEIVLNFKDVEYINSSGIASIVGVLAKARTDGRAVAASGLSDHYRHIFEITRLSDFMTILNGNQHVAADDKAST
jgi:anti-sigma B factor antagonist